MDHILLPHILDMMHTEKNIVEASFCTIIDIPNKTKDNVKARVDQGYAIVQSSTFHLPKTARDGKSLKPILY